MTHDEVPAAAESSPRGWYKLAVLALLTVAITIGYTQFRDTLTLANLAEQEAYLRDLQTQHPVLVYGTAFLIYVIVTGFEKAEMLARLRGGDLSIPAGRVNRNQALLLADCAAAGQPDPAASTEVGRHVSIRRDSR